MTTPAFPQALASLSLLCGRDRDGPCLLAKQLCSQWPSQRFCRTEMLLRWTSHSLPRHCQSWAPKQVEVLWTHPQPSLPSRHCAHAKKRYYRGNFNQEVHNTPHCLNLEEQLLVQTPCPTHNPLPEAMPGLSTNLSLLGWQWTINNSPGSGT